MANAFGKLEARHVSNWSGAAWVSVVFGMLSAAVFAISCVVTWEYLLPPWLKFFAPFSTSLPPVIGVPLGLFLSAIGLTAFCVTQFLQSESLRKILRVDFKLKFQDDLRVASYTVEGVVVMWGVFGTAVGGWRSGVEVISQFVYYFSNNFIQAFMTLILGLVMVVASEVMYTLLWKVWETTLDAIAKKAGHAIKQSGISTPGFAGGPGKSASPAGGGFGGGFGGSAHAAAAGSGQSGPGAWSGSAKPAASPQTPKPAEAAKPPVNARPAGPSAWAGAAGFPKPEVPTAPTPAKSAEPREQRRGKEAPEDPWGKVQAATVGGVFATKSAEPVKAEPVKAEPAKAEPAKAEPAKAEPAKAEPAKAEPAKAEPAKAVTTEKPGTIAADGTKQAPPPKRIPR